MRLTFVPGLLSEKQIVYDATRQQLEVNLHLVPLSGTQCALVMALLAQRERWQATQGREPLVLSVQQLMYVARIPNLDVLRYHICLASARLGAQGLEIVSLRNYGYAIFSTSELLGQPL